MPNKNIDNILSNLVESLIALPIYAAIGGSIAANMAYKKYDKYRMNKNINIKINDLESLKNTKCKNDPKCIQNIQKKIVKLKELMKV